MAIKTVVKMVKMTCKFRGCSEVKLGKDTAECTKQMWLHIGIIHGFWTPPPVQPPKEVRW